MATRTFNEDDLADYDDWDEEWEEKDEADNGYTVVEENKITRPVKQPVAPKVVAPKPVLQIPVQTTSVSGFTINRVSKLRSFNDELRAGYPVSTWFLEKFSKQGIPQANAELEKPAPQPPTVFVVIGHVDAGKSTLMAQLVTKYGKDHIQPKLDHQASGRKNRNRSGSQNNMAWELDVGQDERDHGVTIDAKSKSLAIDDREFVAIDAPGHADYVPSMLLGAMQADAAVLVIDSVKFDSGFSRGGQTKEHVSLIRSLGIHQLVVVLNKIDAIDPDDRVCELESIKSQLTDFIIDEMRFGKIDFVPISAIQGLNIFDPLYPEDEETMCLKSALMQLQPKPHGPAHHSVCVPIVDVNGDKLSGRVEAGSVHEKEKLMVLPSKQMITLSAGKGPGSYLESVSFSFTENTGQSSPSSCGASALIHPGSVLVDPVFPIPNLEAVEMFFARILVINDDFMPIVKGQTVTVNVHTSMIDAAISKIVGKVKEGGVMGPAKCLVKGDVAVVEISVRKGAMIVVEPDCASRVTGRVVLRDRGVTIAAGLIVSHKID